MEREAIIRRASEMKTQKDLLILLNLLKMEDLGEKGHPFNMRLLNYCLNPKRNKSCYRTFTIPKRSGGVRTISAPQRSLKSLLTYTNVILQAFYEAPEQVTGFVPAKSVVDNAERHIGMRYIFNTDIKDFFPSVKQARVWKTLQTKPYGFPKEIASIIAGLCCTEVTVDGETRNALPQGSPCSPTLTNIVCHNLDWKLSGIARRFHLRYSRYADDITFSGNEDVFGEDGAFITELRRVIALEGFTLNEKKTRVQKRGERQEVTGLVVSEHRVNLAREYTRDLDNLLFIWERHGKNAAFMKFLSRYVPKQNFMVGLPTMESVIQGRLQYLKMVRGENDPIWRRLQRQFNRLSGRPEDSCGTDVEYLQYYTIDRFENSVGKRIEFTDEEGKIFPVIEINGRRYFVRTSRYVMTRLKHILESNDTAALEKFRCRYHIGFCRSAAHPEDAPYWLLFRYPPKKDNGQLTDVQLEALVEEMIADQTEAPTSGSPMLSTDETLAALVLSDFDLNTLDKWDKTKSS